MRDDTRDARDAAGRRRCPWRGGGRGRLEGRPLGAPRRPDRRPRLLHLPAVRGAAAARRLPAYADLFFRFDPLAAFSTMLAARQWLPHLALAVVTVGAALVLGRVWCGWICPLGTLLGWFRFRAARRLAPRVPPRLRGVKYVLLGVIAVMAALGSLTLLVLDPIALLTRTFTTSLIPGFDYVVGAVEAAVVDWGPASGAVTWVEDRFRGTVLPVYQPHYAQGVAIFLVFLAVVLLNVFAERFWCRYLCPLGALLGLVAKVQVLRPLVGDGCNGLQRLRARLPRGRHRGGRGGRGRGRRSRRRPRPRRHLRVHDVPGLPGRLPGARGDELRPGAEARTLGRLRPRPAAVPGGGRHRRRDGRPAGHERRTRHQEPRPHPPAGRPGRGRLPLALPALQRVHEGLPDLRPAAVAGTGRTGGAVDTRARLAPGLLRLLVHGVRARVPFGRHPQARPRGQAQAGARHRRDRPGPLPALGVEHALHRLSGDVPHPGQGDRAQRPAPHHAPRRHAGLPGAPQGRRQALHRLRHLRVPSARSRAPPPSSCCRPIPRWRWVACPAAPPRRRADARRYTPADDRARQSDPARPARRAAVRPARRRAAGEDRGHRAARAAAGRTHVVPAG